MTSIGRGKVDAVGTLKRHKVEIVQRYGVERIGVFGSQARGEGRSSSDVDVLVKFKEGEETFDHYMDLKFFLEGLFKRDVDLVILETIKPRLRKAILSEAVYA